MEIKVKETFVSFTGNINIGRFSFFVDINDMGVNLSVDDLVEQVIHFPRVSLVGEPFIERDDLPKFIKKAKKQNPKIIFEINTKGTIRPVGLTNFDNIIFNVTVQLKNSNLEYDDRIKPVILNWFNEASANFRFVVKNDDEIDEANLIVREFGIPKARVFLCPKDEQVFDFVMSRAKYYGYNFVPNFRKLLWEFDGRNLK